VPRSAAAVELGSPVWPLGRSPHLVRRGAGPRQAPIAHL